MFRFVTRTAIAAAPSAPQAAKNKVHNEINLKRDESKENLNLTSNQYSGKEQ